jgi:phosphoglycolate phosphatase-like HAD superfamily hydrolase
VTRPAEAVVLDFDGVVLESLAVKMKAFRRLFSAYPDHVDRILAYHARHLGVSRYVKFAHVYQRILRRRLTSAEVGRLDRRFSRLVRQGVLNCRLVPGALGFLRYASARVPVFVASATPERELRAIVRRRGLGSYFSGIFGAPRSKAEAIRHIVEQRGFDRRAVVFVGDAQTDRKAARAAGVRFIRRLAPGTRASRGTAVRTLAELERLLKSGTCGLQI